ncbi:LysR family transcriptional regulator [Pseudobdellovibrio sp. HCB154]|uniref:LysR family transcriptional regulator n=1 Tax=Pseudobdellovibrio sp. HCB154 TaxID=3386277 RepID=UPI0039175CC0
MDIDRVRYFNTFAETGSLVRASEILHISQPALSKALKTLESEVGLRLLESDGRGLKLTDAGKRFRDETRPLLTEWINVSKKIRDLEVWKPSRIASFEVFTTYFLGHLLKFVDLENLEIHELVPGRMEQAVADGKVDLAITYNPVPKAGVDFIEVAKIKMSVFGLESFRSKKFTDLPFVIPLMPTEGAPSKVIGLDGWPDHLFERKVKYRVTMMESAMEFCREGQAVAYLPEFVVQLHNKRVLPEFRLRELKHPLPDKDCKQNIYLVRRHGNSETSIERQIAKSLRALT